MQGEECRTFDELFRTRLSSHQLQKGKKGAEQERRTLNDVSIAKPKSSPSHLDRLLLFLVLFHRCRNVVLWCIMLSYDEFSRQDTGPCLPLQAGVGQAQDGDDACGGEAQRKGANPAGLERAELGDKSHGCHRSRNQPFAGGRQQQSQMECAVSDAEQIDGGDRNRDIFFIGFNDRCGGNNGGAARET